MHEGEMVTMNVSKSTPEESQAMHLEAGSFEQPELCLTEQKPCGGDLLFLHTSNILIILKGLCLVSLSSLRSH